MKIISIALFTFMLLVSGGSIYMNYEQASKNAIDSNLLADLDKLNELPGQAASETVGDTGREFINQEYEYLKDGIPELQTSGVTDLTKLWIKLGFSIFFGLAALFVVLSQKYNEETQKWAFSTLSLLAGVWIGTIT